MTAQDQVLRTTELLDQIIGDLDWRTALLAQRVSSRWLNVVRSSTSIQHKLGLRAIDRRQRWSLRWGSLGMFTSARKVKEREARLAGMDELVTTSCHATDVFAKFAELGVGRLYQKDYGNEYIFKLDSIPRGLLKNDDSASWRDMHITQPPTTTIDIGTIIHFRDALMYRRITGHYAAIRVHSDSGITLGQVMDIVKRWIQDSTIDTDWSNERFALTTIHMIDDDDYLYRLSQAVDCCG